MYNSPSIDAQGSREEFFVMNMGLKQEFLNRSLSIVLQAQDILKTGKFEMENSSVDFYSNRRFNREAPTYMLTLSYNVNNYKSRKPQEDASEELQENNDLY